MRLRERLVLAAGDLALPGFSGRAAAFGAAGPDRTAAVNRLLSAALAGVPGYAEACSAAGVGAAGIASMKDFGRVPPVTRAALAARGGGGAFARLDSGGTGAAGRAETRLDFEAVAGRYAALLSVLGETGWRMGDRTAALHPAEYGYFNNLGALAGSGQYGKIIFEFFQQYLLYRLAHNRRNLLYGREIFSDPAAALRLAERALAEKPALLITRPDALMAVLKALRGRPDLRPAGLRAVLTVGTALGETVRREAAERLGAQVFNMYASTELGYVALSCPVSGEWLHADEGWHITEQGPGGELVCTDLGNALTPLLRYPSGDYGRAERRSCPCGRSGLMLRVDGRRDKSLETRAGRLYEAALIDRVFPSGLPFFQVDSAAGKIILPAGAAGALPEIERLLELPRGGYGAAPSENFKISSSGKFCFLV